MNIMEEVSSVSNREKAVIKLVIFKTGEKKRDQWKYKLLS